MICESFCIPPCITQSVMDDSTYHVYLGGQDNTRSGVFTGFSLVPIADVATPGILSCDSSTEFWMTWKNNHVQVNSSEITPLEIVTNTFCMPSEFPCFPVRPWTSHWIEALLELQHLTEFPVCERGQFCQHSCWWSSLASQSKCWYATLKLLQAILLRNQLLLSPCLLFSGSSIKLDTGLKLDYKHLWVTTYQDVFTTFRIQTCRNAHILLTSVDGVQTKEAYEVILGKDSYKTVIKQLVRFLCSSS